LQLRDRQRVGLAQGAKKVFDGGAVHEASVGARPRRWVTPLARSARRSASPDAALESAAVSRSS
jgi:hypothetical protein